MVYLSKGDITKRDEILWNCTIDELKPYIKFIERDILFREAVIGTFVDEKKSKGYIEDEYCKACKLTHPDIDCSKCSKDIQVPTPK